MKVFFFITFLAITLASCGKNDPLENLPGTWTLSSVEVNGEDGTGTGSITFDEDLSGEMAITFMGAGIQITRGGSFTYEATNDNITFTGLSQDPITWSRERIKAMNRFSNLSSLYWEMILMSD
jgi:hypothetical protein